VLSSAWPLFNLDHRDAKLSYAGTDKVNGKPVHKLKYTPRNAGDLMSQRDNRFKLVEEFSDFQPTGKLMLPHTYTIDLTVELSNRTQTLEWTINLQQFSFTETIDARVFKGEKD
jgi:hypothetical protein